MKPLRVTVLALLAVTLVLLAACTPALPPSLAALAGARVGQAAAATPLATARPGLITGATPAPTVPLTATVPLATEAATMAPSTAAPAATPATAATPAAAAPAVGAASSAGHVIAGDLQSLLEQVYTNTNVSVVNIQITSSQTITGTGRFPGLPNNPHGPNGGIPLPQQALGSGFVWDSQGHIVTNNHVVDGASKISVTFYDGATVAATLVGRDPDSDLAVIKVDPTGLDLHPVTMGDSTTAQVGQFVVAIGNPFGLANTMTFGIVSALGRSLPAGGDTSGFSTGPTFTIPDIIQTDAPINPGNSGGVLLDLQGHVLGVTSAIESGTGSNAGVGFAIPSAIVQSIVPSLIQTGKAQHPYIGISGTTLSPDLAQAMSLNASQRGALVIDVSPNSPAAQAGLQASTKQVTINGEQTTVGGDVIVRIDNQPVQKFDDLTAYLANKTKVGQKVTLTVLRNGQQTTVPLTLGDRPAQTAAPSVTRVPRGQATPQATPQGGLPPSGGLATPAAPATPGSPSTGQAPRGRAYLGVTVTALTPEIAQAMKLGQNQQGALVEQVVMGSPAETAGLQAGTQDFTTSNGGPTVTIGGDVITAVDNQTITSDQDLVQAIGSLSPGQQVTLTVLRNGNKMTLSVTLGARPGQ